MRPGPGQPSPAASSPAHRQLAHWRACMATACFAMAPTAALPRPPLPALPPHLLLQVAVLPPRRQRGAVRVPLRPGLPGQQQHGQPHRRPSHLHLPLLHDLFHTGLLLLNGWVGALGWLRPAPRHRHRGACSSRCRLFAPARRAPPLGRLVQCCSAGVGGGCSISLPASLFLWAAGALHVARRR